MLGYASCSHICSQSLATRNSLETQGIIPTVAIPTPKEVCGCEFFRLLASAIHFKECSSKSWAICLRLSRLGSSQPLATELATAPKEESTFEETVSVARVFCARSARALLGAASSSRHRRRQSAVATES
jgi:hypothetical protein